jgi:hypothetical protein
MDGEMEHPYLSERGQVRRAQGRSPNSEPDTFVLHDRMTFTMQLDATMAKDE